MDVAFSPSKHTFDGKEALVQQREDPYEEVNENNSSFIEEKNKYMEDKEFYKMSKIQRFIHDQVTERITESSLDPNSLSRSAKNYL